MASDLREDEEFSSSKESFEVQRRNLSSSRRAKKTKRSSLRLISDQQLSVFVSIVFVATLLSSTIMLNKELTYYPQIWLGATPSEVLYGFGAPQEQRSKGALETWVYVLPAYKEYVEFENGRAVEVGCERTSGDCPKIWDVKSGIFETELFSALGVPSKQVLINGSKEVYYEDLSLSMKLEKFRITSISLHRPRELGFSYFYRFFLFLLP